MFDELHQAAYRHVVINHVPIIGSALGAIGLLIGILIRQRAALVAPLAILFVAGLSVWPVVETGEDAYKPIHRIADEAGVDWLDEHMDRADRAAWSFYVLAGVAAATLIAVWKFPRAATPLAFVTLLVAFVCAAVAVWIAQPGGRIRHEEFRPAAVAE